MSEIQRYIAKRKNLIRCGPDEPLAYVMVNLVSYPDHLSALATRDRQIAALKEQLATARRDASRDAMEDARS